MSAGLEFSEFLPCICPVGPEGRVLPDFGGGEEAAITLYRVADLLTHLVGVKEHLDQMCSLGSVASTGCPHHRDFKKTARMDTGFRQPSRS